MSSYLEIRDYFASKDCKLLTTYDEFVENKMGHNSNFRIIGACGCEKMCWLKNLKYNGNGHICGHCSRKKPKLIYDDVVELFRSRNCTLLLEHQDFDQDKTNRSTKFTFIATCGHQRTITYSDFYRNNRNLCLDCSKQNVIKNQTTHLVNGVSNTNMMEYEGLLYLQESLKERFDIVKLQEGMKADAAYKPKEIDENSWIGIQIKTTKGYNNKKNAMTLIWV